MATTQPFEQFMTTPTCCGSFYGYLGHGPLSTLTNSDNLREAFHQFPMDDFRPTFYNPFEIKHRRRTSRAQLKILEKVLATNPKPNATVRRILAQKLNMSPRGVQIWFQNRRAKAKLERRKALAKSQDETVVDPKPVQNVPANSTQQTSQQDSPSTEIKVVDATNEPLYPQTTQNNWAVHPLSQPESNAGDLSLTHYVKAQPLDSEKTRSEEAPQQPVSVPETSGFAMWCNAVAMPEQKGRSTPEVAFNDNILAGWNTSCWDRRSGRLCTLSISDGMNTPHPTRGWSLDAIKYFPLNYRMPMFPVDLYPFQDLQLGYPQHTTPQTTQAVASSITSLPMNQPPTPLHGHMENSPSYLTPDLIYSVGSFYSATPDPSCAIDKPSTCYFSPSPWSSST